MRRLFPNARDYKTITIKMTDERVQAVEGFWGGKLEPSEKKEFNFYEITAVLESEPQQIGTVIALAGKGKYGAIEIVIGVDKSQRISGVYIQRSRERANKVIKSKEFLAQFVGRSTDDTLKFPDGLVGADKAPVGTETVRATIRKMLCFYRALYRHK